MAGRISSAMEKALEMIKGGMSAYQAARVAGIRDNSIYQNPEYRRMKGLPAKPGGKRKGGAK